jgi:hypothetical protein
MQQRGKHSATTIVLMLEIMSSMWFMQSGYKEDNLGDSVESQPVKRRLGGWCEMAASLTLVIESSVLYRRLWR